MPFDERGFAADFAKHLGLVRKDIETLSALPPKDRNSVMSRVMNHLIDIKNVPEFVEAWAFGIVINMIEGFISKQLGGKREPGPLPTNPGRGTKDHDDYGGTEFD
jgi:hypothetical protein